MHNPILKFLGISVAYLILFGLGEYLYHFKKMSVEKTRKLVHLGSGGLAMLFPLLFQTTAPVVLLCGSFLLLLWLAKRFGFLASVNNISRQSAGSYWFPIAVSVCFYAQSYFGHMAFYYLPLLTLTLADPMACFVGKKMPLYVFNLKHSQKSIGGSLAFFLTAFGLAHLFLGFGFQHDWTACALFASTTCLFEFFGGKGHDNISIPLAGVGALYFTQSNLILC